jgi:Ca2+:H+ antiporter
VSGILVHARRLRSGSRPVRVLIATVIVAIVGNAAEHGGAVVSPSRGMVLASEIAISSSAQVAVFIPAVALLSFLVTPALPLSFRRSS